MAMKLNPFSFPELRDLPETVSRQEVVRSVKRRVRWWVLKNCVSTLLLLAFPIFMIGDFFGVWSWIVIALFVLGGFVAWWAARGITKVRLRQVLRNEHQIPICVNCGYVGVSMDTQICSECGKEVGDQIPG